jgi:isopenicillin N synthase-like dioxygenase
MKGQKRGIDAKNKEFAKYDQVKKDQDYLLVEHEDREVFDDEYQIATCDISQFIAGNEEERRSFSICLGSALEEIGFAVLTGHGIDPQLYERAKEKTRVFFESIPLEKKLKYKYNRTGSVNQGYFPIKETTIIHPDLVEGWVFCRRAFDFGQSGYNEKDYWPEAGYEPHFRMLVQKHESLILPIMQAILQYFDLDSHLYDQKLTKTNFGFRLNYYPPISEADDASGAGRMLGHEDVDLFTILPSQDIEGLQVLNRKNGKWIRLNPPAGSIILNTGDYMQRITNDRLPSTTHRVSKPRDRVLNDVPRISFPMAVYVWENEILEVLPGLGEPKYEPISAIQFHTQTTSKYYGDDYAKNIT